MSIASPLRSRRFAARTAETIHSLITFRLRQEWFALPLTAVQKVVLLGQVYGDPGGTGISLTVYQDQELVVVDVAQQIFNQPLPTEGPAAAPQTPASPELLTSGEMATQRLLLVLQNQQEERFGLPIDSQPILRKVPASSFVPLPTVYRNQGQIHCLSATMIQLPEHPPIFLLDPQLLEAKLATAGSRSSLS